jgi:hypothetical protein
MMANDSDFTEAVFQKRIAEYGFKPTWMGYYSLPADGHNTRVCILNAGPSRREKLAYLIRENNKVAERKDVR